MTLVYGYIRWSSDRQEDGDTRKRQMQLIENWLTRHPDCKLDTSLGSKGLFIDEGMTGFASDGARNLDKYQLGAFIRYAESGRIAKGSRILVENTDRLSRESSVFALNLITRLLVAGVVVVTLAPEQEFRSDADLPKLLPIMVGADRAHDESKTKKHRAAKAWATKREGVADGSQILSTRVPAWCRVVNVVRKNNRLVSGEIQPIGERVAVVRRIFKLAADGNGCRTISLRLNAEGVPTFTTQKKWGQARVFQILKSRSVLGEYQPHVGVQGSKRKGRAQTRTKTGEVVKDYYPAIIDPDLFAKVDVEVTKRASFRGRRTQHVNLFAGMLVDAKTGEKFSYMHNSSQPITIVGNSDSKGLRRFNAEVFEAAILQEMRELKASDVFEERDSTGEIANLSAILAEKNNQREEWREQILNNPKLLRTIGDMLTNLEDDIEELNERLTTAQRKAASPLSEVWGEFQSVAGLLEKDKSPETRLRVQTLLRGLIKQVTLCIIQNGRKKRKRVAAVQISFLGGAARIYCITHTYKNPHGTGEGWSVSSFRHEAGQHERDLSKDWKDIEIDELENW